MPPPTAASPNRIGRKLNPPLAAGAGAGGGGGGGAGVATGAGGGGGGAALGNGRMQPPACCEHSVEM